MSFLKKEKMILATKTTERNIEDTNLIDRDRLCLILVATNSRKLRTIYYSNEKQKTWTP